MPTKLDRFLFSHYPGGLASFLAIRLTARFVEFNYNAAGGLFIHQFGPALIMEGHALFLLVTSKILGENIKVGSFSKAIIEKTKQSRISSTHLKLIPTGWRE